MKVVYDDVVKKYGHVVGVDRLHLQIQGGEFIVLLGPSGCGKTTTLRMLAGLETATSGNIYIGDNCVNEVPPRDRDVAMVFQSYALYPHMTVAGNIAYPLRVRRIPRHEISGRVQKVAELLGIGELLQRRPKELSGGQRQRVALARAIVRQPRVFLMDEPLSNLDAKLRLYTRTELKALQQQLGVTTIFVTHDQAEAMTMADRIAVLDAGELQQLGTPDTVYQRPANLLVAQFIGTPPMNTVAARHENGSLLLEGGWRIEAPRIAKDAAELRAGLRPEAIELDMVAREGAQPAEVLVSEPLGSEVIVNVKLGDVLLKVRTGPDVRPDPGTRVFLRAQPAAVRVFDASSGAALN